MEYSFPSTFLLMLLLTAAIPTSISMLVADQQEADRVLELPGQPYNAESFKQYAGYVTVNEISGRELFYFFSECSSDESASKPLVLWLNGGPGCSSIAGGFAQENGPYFIHPNGTGLYLNRHAWNKDVNMLWLESPTGVGFSFAQHNFTENEVGGDNRTAEDTYTFLIGWLERFPQYKTSDFYITGESYAGHFIPQLAEVILHHNKEAYLKINLKGFMVGNPTFDQYWDNVGRLDYYHSHAMISDETYEGITKNCDFHDVNCCSELCNKIYNEANPEVGSIDPYSIYTPSCTTPGTVLNAMKSSRLHTQYPGFMRARAGFDPCTTKYAKVYFNRPDVQKALHANVSGEIPYPWAVCNNPLFDGWTDSPFSMLPTYQDLIAAADLKIWVYSGDADSIVPVTSTRYALAALNLTVVTPWYAWYDHQQVGGRAEVYKGLTYLTFRGAGHQPPLLQRSRFSQMLRHFIADENLPSSPYL